MKKFFLLLIASTVLSTGLFAQDKPAEKSSKSSAKEVKSVEPKKLVEEKKDTKTKVAGMKKDGTPDKRFKENKADAPKAVVLKKDGTPDMRFKENKEAAKKDKKKAN